MNTMESRQQIGQRIATLRKRKDLSQEELARKIRMSRSSLAQIELGNRGIDILELQRLSLALGFSLDDFISDDFMLANEQEIAYEVVADETEERVSDPALRVDKFINVLLYVLERCAGKPNVGETVLNKLLYFIDFNYYELYEEHLTGAEYRRLPYGPTPQKMDLILAQMIDKGQLQRVKTKSSGLPLSRYFPLVKADLTRLKASEKDVIDRVIEQMGDWSASTIINYSHKDIPWLASREGEAIRYELAFYRDIPFSVRNYGDENEEQ